MGYVMKEVKPGVFELVFEEEAPAAPAKGGDGDDAGDENGDAEDEDDNKKEKEGDKGKEEGKTAAKEEEEDLPVVDAGVLKSSALSRLIRDLAEIKECPLATVNAAPLESNVFEWHANILGSSQTVFCGMVFHLIMTFPENYPVKPPNVRMMNYISHPNVFGEYICLDMLEDGMWSDPSYVNQPYAGWTTAYSVQSILVQLQAFFSTEAYSDDAYDVVKAQKSIDQFKCTCSHSKDSIWPPISPDAIKQVKAERDRLLIKSGKPPVFNVPKETAKPEASADKEGDSKKGATPTKGKQAAKGKEPAAEKEDKGPQKQEKGGEKQDKEKEKEAASAAPKVAPAAPKVAPAKPAPEVKAPAVPTPILTKSGQIPLRRYIPGQGLAIPQVGKRIGFGERTNLELQWQKGKLNKRYRDSEIEIKSTSDGYVYELGINEPPPRSETKDVIYFWGEVYPVDEVDVEDNDRAVAARRAAGIPLVKEMTVSELLNARPLNIPKQDSLKIVLTENGGGRPFRAKAKYAFNCVYNLEHYEGVKAATWQLYALDEKNPKNLLILNLKSNKFNLHFLSSVQYFVHVDKKPEPKAEPAKGGKRVDNRGKRQNGNEAKPKEGSQEGKPARGAGRGGQAKEKEAPKGNEEQKEANGAAGGRGADRGGKGGSAGRGRGKSQGKGDQAEEAGTETKSKRDYLDDAPPVKKYVPPPSTPLFISSNFGGPPPVPKEQRRRDRKGKDKVDAAPGRGRRISDPVGTGKGKEKVAAPAVHDLNPPAEKVEPKEADVVPSGVQALAPAADEPVIAVKEKEKEKEKDEPKAAEPKAGEANGQQGKGNRKRQNRGKGPNKGPKEGEAPKDPKEPQPEGSEKRQKKGGDKGAKGSKRLTFERLPPEIRSHIFSFLGRRDLVRAAAVSHEFEALSRGILSKAELFCYHTKLTFQEDTLGIGVTYKYYPGSKNIESICSQLDLLSYTAFHVDKIRKSVWKVRFHDWLPLYLGYRHGLKAIPLCKASIARILTGSEVGFEPKMAVTLFTKLMNTMIVDLMKCDSWASEKALEGYFAFHHWLLVFIELYPQLLDWINETIGNFIAEERYRTKRVVPALGEFIPLLALTDKYSWKDVSEAYLLENFDRNQKWVLQKYPALGNLTNEKEPVDKTRIIKTQDATTVSQRLLMFHVFFLNHIVKPKGKSVADIKRMYDESYGRPADRMKFALQQKIKELQKISNWIEFFSLIDMPLPTPRQLTYWLRGSVHNSARKRYHNRADYAGKTRQKKKKAGENDKDTEDHRAEERGLDF